MGFLNHNEVPQARACNVGRITSIGEEILTDFATGREYRRNRKVPIDWITERVAVPDLKKRFGESGASAARWRAGVLEVSEDDGAGSF